jgi:hypothetical protein
MVGCNELANFNLILTATKIRFIPDSYHVYYFSPFLILDDYKIWNLAGRVFIFLFQSSVFGLSVQSNVLRLKANEEKSSGALATLNM